MPRRVLISLACFPVLAACVYLATPTPPQATARQGKPLGSGPRFVVFPYLQYATADSITVMWETSSPGTSLVRYGLTALTENAKGADDATMHEVTLKGLKQGVPHIYEVTTTTRDGKVTSPLLTFQTALGTEDAYSFVLIGDTQKNPKVTKEVATLAWQRRPNFVVHLGDVVDNGPDKKEWTEELFAPCKELFSRVPVYPCIGNHEKNHAHYYRYFSLPVPKYFYRFSYGNADFFSLDTNKKVAPGSEQYKWLDAELAKSTAKWKFVYHHHPAYTSDDDDYGNTWRGVRSAEGDKNVRQLVLLYEKHGVDMVFNGHIHVYERTWAIRAGKVDRARGVTYITSGGGGGRLENHAPVPTFFKAQCRSDYHFCHVAIHGGRFSLRVFDHKGTLFDTLDIDK